MVSRANALTYMAHQQVLTAIEIDNIRRERPTKTSIFRAEITKFETPINTQQQINNRSLQVFSTETDIELLQLLSQPGSEHCKRL